MAQPISGKCSRYLYTKKLLTGKLFQNLFYVAEFETRATETRTRIRRY
jgi:hypothetical protein